jgi:hypothetical protein
LPTSIADLAGYSGTRVAHDRLCAVDASLPDYGDRFEGVFQPCLGLLSTRRAERRDASGPPLWPLERRDLDEAQKALLERLSSLDKVSPTLFRERGYQTTATDRHCLRPVGEAPRNSERDLFTGSEVTEFRRLPARLEVDPARLSQPLRSEEECGAVALWIRQTARFPIAVSATGAAFRNSIIAGFEDDAHDRFLLLAYLNSTPVRWYHFQSQRDARQGMPQLKVAHLRALPRPPTRDTPIGAELSRLGASLDQRNSGVEPAERERLDGWVADFFELSPQDALLVRSWGAQNPPPVSRFLRRNRDDER